MTRAAVDSLSRLPLSQLLAEKPAWSVNERLELARRLALALQTLHRQGQTHRALDAATVTVDEQFRPQIVPPAGPRRFGGDQSDPEFCPPELAQGAAVELPAEIEAAAAILRQQGTSFDPRRVDVYQLGVLLCQMLTGEPFLNYLYSPTCKAKVPPIARSLLERCLGENSADSIIECDSLIKVLDDLIRQCEAKQATSTSETPPQGSVVVGPGETPARGKVAARATVREKLPFQRLGHFEIAERIGAGGMGDVYKGYDASLDRYVAIKVLAAPLARDEEFVRRFSAEATAAAKVSHPNVVPIYCIGQDAEHHFFAMQFIEGQSLSQRLLNDKRLSVDEAVAIVEQCLAGLEAAHSQALIHRDVKPGNILLERTSRRAILVDFGLARHLNSGSRMTATGVVMGTVDYVAPEQARGKAVDGRADIYSLGVMFYELLAGRLPFLSDSPTAMIFQHAYEEPFPLKQAAPNVPQPLVDVIAHMMAKEPAERYASCAEVSADLRAFREGRPVKAAAACASPAGMPAPVGVAVALPPRQTSNRSASPRVSADESAADWGANYDALLPSENPLQRARDFAATMFRRHAPQHLQEMQGTTLQMDAAVADYERRRNRLAKLLKEARSIESDLSEQIKSQIAAAAEAARAAVSSTDDDVKDAALVKKCECEDNATSLRSQLDVQRQETEDLESQLSKADATLTRLRSQQNMLKARLKAAEAYRQMEGGRPEPARHRWLVPLAVGAGTLALVTLLLTFSLLRSPSAETYLPGTKAPPYAASKVAFVIGPHDFQPGDNIVIEEVWSELGSLNKGDVVTVKGTYTLASHPNARFCFYLTQDSGDPPDHNPGITMPVVAGSAPFELKRSITSRGRLHLGFYDVQKGNGIGNVYFGTPSQMQEIAHWNLGTGSTAAVVGDKFVTEGVGWGGFRVGAARDDLVKAFGPLEPSPGTQRTGWIRSHHIDCWFDEAGRAVEILFAKGFTLPLASGIRIGSSESEVSSAYGVPNRVVNKSQTKMFEFSKRGVLMWLSDGKVISFTVFKPTNPTKATNPTFTASATPSLSVNGLADTDFIAATEFPQQWRSNDAFANITGAGRILFPTLPVTSFVLDAEIVSRNPAGRLVIRLGNRDYCTYVVFGNIWDGDKNAKRILCRYFSGDGFGCNWNGGRDYEAGARLKLKIVVPDALNKWLYVNGEPALSRPAGMATDLTLEILGEGDADATIYSCTLRKLVEDDVRRLGLEMPQRCIDIDPDLPARLDREAAGLGEVPEQGSSFRASATGTVMNWINPGEFVMGSSLAGNGQFGKGAQRVRLTSGYWIGRYKLMQGEWKRLMGNNPSRVQGSPYLPVNWVSWVDAAAFCRKLTDAERQRGRVPEGYEYRLPTEAEWEYACLAGSEGEDSPGGRLSRDWTAPPWRELGTQPPNAWGLCDMIGNVPEWCADAWRPYPADGQTKVIPDRLERGGLDLDRFVTRGRPSASARFMGTPTFASDYRGFRLVLGKELKLWGGVAPAPAVSSKQ